MSEYVCMNDCANLYVFVKCMRVSVWVHERQKDCNRSWWSLVFTAIVCKTTSYTTFDFLKHKKNWSWTYKNLDNLYMWFYSVLLKNQRDSWNNNFTADSFIYRPLRACEEQFAWMCLNAWHVDKKMFVQTEMICVENICSCGNILRMCKLNLYNNYYNGEVTERVREKKQHFVIFQVLIHIRRLWGKISNQ